MKTNGFFCFFLIIAFCVQAQQRTCPKWGPYVGTNNMKNESGVLMMSDVMFPSTGIAPFTYASSINFKIGKSGGYCGIQQADLQTKRKGNNIFSIWDFPNKIQIMASYKDPGTYVGGFGGEGTGLHSHNDFGWIADQWYTNIVRSWTTNDSTTFVGYWLFDQTSDTWRHYVTFEVPEAHALLHGDIGSFLENFADETKATRLGRYRNYWLLKVNGQWLHPDSLIAQAGPGAWAARKIGEDGVELSSCGTTIGPDRYRFAVNMPAKPVIVKTPAVYDLAAYYDKTKQIVCVDWSVSARDMPQLSYAVSLYDNLQCSGKPIATVSGTNPDITMVSLPVKGVELKRQNYYVALVLTDIFNQSSPAKIFELHELHP
jgi:hypothetical protein